MIWLHGSPAAASLPSLLQLSKTTRDLQQLHSLILKTALDHCPFFISRFILSSSSISIDITRLFFDCSPVVPPIFAWNTIIRAYAVPSSPLESVKLFSRLLRAGLKPDNFTYPFVLKACGICSLVENVGAVHSMVYRVGIVSDRCVGNTLVRAYGACDEIFFARQVFDEMVVRDVASWSSMMATCVACNYPLHAFTVFREMKKNQVNEVPNSVTLLSLVSACTRLLNISIGKSIHSHIIINGIQLSSALGSALLEMYAKCGKMDKAYHLFNSITESERNLHCWTVMISSLADHVGREDAPVLLTTLFSRMTVENGILPDPLSFSAILSACSHLGLVDDGRKYFNQMVHIYGIRPNLHHYGCMVDMLGRAGLIENAYELIRSMPMKPNSVILRSFLGSCRNHGSDHLCEDVKTLLLMMEPEAGANYVLAAAASFSHEDDAACLRKAMKKKNVKKVTGCSWVEGTSS